jgi:hypothetical protein
MARSALTLRQKRDILLQEASRRLRNCHPGLPWATKAGHLTNLNIAMMECGHAEAFRDLITTRAVARYQNSLKNHQKGKKNMYRTREERRLQWEAQGGKATAADWFRKAGFTSKINIPATTDSKLAEAVQGALDTVPGPIGSRTKVVEMPGGSVKRNLVRSNPFPREHCGRALCPWREREEPCNEFCFRESVGYAARCMECRQARLAELEDQGKTPEEAENEVKEDVYIGETSRSVVTRKEVHLNDFDGAMFKKTGVKNARKRKEGEEPTAAMLEARDRRVRMAREAREEEEPGGPEEESSSWMADHCLAVHGGREARFEFHTTGAHRKPLYRQLDEYVRIQTAEEKGTLATRGKEDDWKVKKIWNRKHEWWGVRNESYGRRGPGPPGR